MRKLALILSSGLLLFLFVTSVSAKEDASSSPFRVRKEAAKERVADKKENLVERRRANIRKFLGNMIARLRAMVVRLETLIERIESRLTKIASESPDTDLTAVKADVAEAKTLLAATKDKITDLEGMEEELVGTDSPKEVFADVKAKLESIKKDLKEVHRLLVHVIGDIKGLRVGETKGERE